MPILPREPNIYPETLLDEAAAELAAGDDSARRWWAFYTRSRQEKQMMRKLLTLRVPFYTPLLERRRKSPAGRIRNVYEPLFSNYVFVFGDHETRYSALTTNCVSKVIEVVDGLRLAHDLRQLQQLLDMDIIVAPERRLVPGMRVRVRSGPLAGFEGTILRREHETRLLVAVDFTQQGVSALLDDCQVDEI